MNQSTTSERLYTIGEAARALGKSTSTLKRWEQLNQVTPQRVANGQRIYTESDLARLRALKESNV